MVTTTKTICDVINCNEEADYKVDCCAGWIMSDGSKAHPNKYKKFEKPLKEKQVDLCEPHWKKWSILTCKLLRMDREGKR
ncbi:hypothetical protein LCGC14_2373320 [marine sediment metagenome]|uniref:Uncharacterized protein n=1 Tax=marine sediment metagenome TaxID=412755 RepID=A0A0F9C352_9ZZZZ